MTRVLLAENAVADLDQMIISHGLPDDTRARVKRSLRPLERFPYVGRALAGRWEGARFVLGPWPWMIIVYDFHEQDDEVVVLAFQDGRSSTAARPS